MLTGKAYSRAVRGHMIIEQPLTKLIVDKLKDTSNFEELENVYNDVIQGKIGISEIVLTLH